MPFIPFMILSLVVILLWEKTPWLIILLLGAAAIWVFHIVSSARAKNLKIGRIRKQFTKSKADFLKDAFDISQADCEKLDFDGRFFLHGRDVPYEDYASIRNTLSSIIKVADANLPHVKSWKYQRVDGGPDLRYRDNTVTIISERHTIALDGLCPYKLSVFCYQGDGQAVSKLIQRFEAFLIGAQVNNYEALFERYQSAHGERIMAEGEHSRLQREITECESVISAASKLALIAGTPDSLDPKIAVATARRDACLAENNRICQRIANHTDQEIAAITETKKQSEVALLRDKIVSFS